MRPGEQRAGCGSTRPDHDRRDREQGAPTSTIAPPAASAHCRAAARPSTADSTPTPTAPNSVPRNERARSRLVATGSTMSAATSSTPTMRIAATTVTAVSTASSALSARAGIPATRADVLVEHDREQRAPGDCDRHDDERAEADDGPHVVGGRGEDRPEQVGLEIGVGRRAAGEHHARRDAAVEHEREREVTRGSCRGCAGTRSPARRRSTTTSAVHVGDVPSSRLAPMPATAT